MVLFIRKCSERKCGAVSALRVFANAIHERTLHPEAHPHNCSLASSDLFNADSEPGEVMALVGIDAPIRSVQLA